MTAGSQAGMPPDALRVAIVDDEELARLRLRTLLADCVAPPARVVAEFGSAQAALQGLGQQPCDVLLLDIHMPGLDGLQLAARLRGQPQAPAVVFVTAHAEHALAAFEVQAVDYLTKPVRRQRLQDALARVQAHAAMRAPAADEPVIVVPERGGLVRVPLSQVLYLKAELKYVTVRTATGSHLIEASLTELESRLGARFVRIHRNAIVACRAVRALQRRGGADPQAAPEAGEPHEGGDTWAVCVEPAGEWLAVSRRQLATVREALAADVAR